MIIGIADFHIEAYKLNGSYHQNEKFSPKVGPSNLVQCEPYFHAKGEFSRTYQFYLQYFLYA